jgi:hypothetical protein
MDILVGSFTFILVIIGLLILWEETPAPKDEDEE